MAALPRQLPLVLPLGDGYPPEALAQAIGSPPQAGLLPSIPFGWQGSSLPVAASQLEAVISNLLGSLHEDGFEKVLLAAPAGIRLNLDAECLALRHPEASPATPRGSEPCRGSGKGQALPTDRPADEMFTPGLDPAKVVLIPIGHTEQHGYHLALSTDTVIIAAISQGAAAAAPELALSLPVTPYGVSTHRRAFAGTFNAGGRAFEDFWLGVIDQLASRGVEMVYLMSGHGGSCSFLTNVVKYAGEQHPEMFCATAWLYLSGPQGTAALERYRRSPRGGMGHACELETALMLHLRPDLVHMARVVDEMDTITTPSYTMDWVEGGTLVANPPWEDETTTGAYGAGSLATPETGKLWLEAAVAEKVGHIHEIIEQHTRRCARRQSRGNKAGFLTLQEKLA